jgi:hypothetical protein
MIRTLKKIPKDNQLEGKFLAAGKAVLEHYFDNHEFCGPWCPRKRLTEQQRLVSERYYRNKTTDGKLYSILHEKFARFVTLERLLEVAHGMDTQVNESFNNTASCMAPKNKVYCATSLLINQLLTAVAMNTLGFEEYFRRLFIKLGITMMNNIKYYLQAKEKTRSNQLA